jgi:hypothetical protein
VGSMTAHGPSHRTMPRAADCALPRIEEERCVAHVQRVQPLRKQRPVRLLGSGLQRVGEEVEPNIGVQPSRAGRAPEMLLRQPAPAGCVVRKREVRSPARTAADLTRQAGCVRRELLKRDWMAAPGHKDVRSEVLKRIVQAHSAVRDGPGEDVSREYLRQ